MKRCTVYPRSSHGVPQSRGSHGRSPHSRVWVLPLTVSEPQPISPHKGLTVSQDQKPFMSQDVRSVCWTSVPRPASPAERHLSRPSAHEWRGAPGLSQLEQRRQPAFCLAQILTSGFVSQWLSKGVQVVATGDTAEPRNVILESALRFCRSSRCP